MKESISSETLKVSPDYIIVKKCTKETAWYSDKIGFTFKIDEKISFPNVYTIRISYKKGKANYGTIDIDDAEVITPIVKKQMAIFMGQFFKKSLKNKKK